VSPIGFLGLMVLQGNVAVSSLILSLYSSWLRIRYTCPPSFVDLHFSRAVPTLVLNVIRSTFVGSSTSFITKCPPLDLVRYPAMDLINAPLVVPSEIAVGYQYRNLESQHDSV
jgi:hypothetical protein